MTRVPHRGVHRGAVRLPGGAATRPRRRPVRRRTCCARRPSGQRWAAAGPADATRADEPADGVESARAVAERSRLRGSTRSSVRTRVATASAVAWGRRAETDARAVAGSAALADAYRRCTRDVAGRDARRTGRTATLALALYEQLGDRAAQSRALNNLAVQSSGSRGGAETRSRCSRRRSEARTRPGDTVGAAATRYNVGDVLVQPGGSRRRSACSGHLVPLLRDTGIEDFRAATVRRARLGPRDRGRAPRAGACCSRRRARCSTTSARARRWRRPTPRSPRPCSRGSPREAAGARARCRASGHRSGGRVPASPRCSGYAGRALLDAGQPVEAEACLEQALVAGRARRTDRAGVHPRRARRAVRPPRSRRRPAHPWRSQDSAWAAGRLGCVARPAH